MRSCVCSDSLRLLHFPLLAVHLLSYRPVFPPGHHLHLPRCGGQIPCALQLMRTLAPLPSTTLSHILEASESTRFGMGESLPNHHEDHVAGKGCNSLQHYNLVHKFIPMLQAMQIPAAKAAVDKECEKLEKIPAWDLTKVRSKKRGDR